MIFLQLSCDYGPIARRIEREILNAKQLMEHRLRFDNYSQVRIFLIDTLSFAPYIRTPSQDDLASLRKAPFVRRRLTHAYAHAYKRKPFK